MKLKFLEKFALGVLVGTILVKVLKATVRDALDLKRTNLRCVKCFTRVESDLWCRHCGNLVAAQAVDY
jgi:hypothetical protein